MNHSGPKDTTGADSVAYVSHVAPTPDGGFIVAGFFNLYQGHEVNGIAKIDQHGAIEPQYFTGSGPGNAFREDATPTVFGITPSAFGGYYVVGNFRSWNGQPSQPIIRLHGLNVGLKEHEREIQKLKVFPNPAKEIVSFQCNTNEMPEEVLLIDMQGKSVKAQINNTGYKRYEVDVSQLKSGMYFLKVISDGEVSVGKFVKE